MCTQMYFVIMNNEMCEKIIYHEEFHTLFGVLRIKQWPATTKINMKLTLVILLLLGTTTQVRHLKKKIILYTYKMYILNVITWFQK